MGITHTVKVGSKFKIAQYNHDRYHTLELVCGKWVEFNKAYYSSINAAIDSLNVELQLRARKNGEIACPKFTY
jgi:hypothetical protein